VIAPPDPGTSSGRAAWFHCFAGIAGDMALGSLLDAGADVAEVMALLRRLPLRGWNLRAEPVLRAGIAATRAVVDVTDDVVVRTHAHIVGLVEEARLPDRVARRSLATFAALAEVEGRLHRRPPEQVHFHEVGSHDTVIDVVGTASALEVLGIDDLAASPVATGMGTVRSAHGFLPNPSPAVVQLLRGIPTWGRDVAVELTTPTGAAILAANVERFGPLPPMRIASTGFGAGARELDGLPNCTQVVVGELMAEGPAPGQPVALLETNVDDVTGEVLAHTVESVLSLGAHDAWITPVVMKKGRPGHTVSVLVDPVLADTVRAALEAETGTLGVRGTILERWPVTRRMDRVEVDGAPVRVKVSPGRVKVEQLDAARAAAVRGLPLRDVLYRAETVWRRRNEGDAASESDRRGPEPPPDAPTPA
jgi:pyridinium-3,5-bisthiocarboxylic acid mononucleotide nickel chelatase